MKLGVLASAGGSAFIDSFDILNDLGLITSEDILVITDRACGIEEKCSSRDIVCERISEKSRKALSAKILEVLKEFQCDLVILYFLRIITEDIYSNFITINIHPSFLPLYKGLNAVDQALEKKSNYLGATAHLVEEDLDSGPVIAQVMTPIHNQPSVARAYRISHIQKVYLTLFLIDSFINKDVKFDISENKFYWITELEEKLMIKTVRLLEKFQDLASKNNVEVF